MLIVNYLTEIVLLKAAVPLFVWSHFNDQYVYHTTRSRTKGTPRRLKLHRQTSNRSISKLVRWQECIFDLDSRYHIIKFASLAPTQETCMRVDPDIVPCFDIFIIALFYIGSLRWFVSQHLYYLHTILFLKSRCKRNDK